MEKHLIFRQKSKTTNSISLYEHQNLHIDAPLVLYKIIEQKKLTDIFLILVRSLKLCDVSYLINFVLFFKTNV